MFQMFLTDVLFNSPRLRFSARQKELILKWGKEVESKDIPSLDQLESFQAWLLTELGDPTTQVTSAQGNVFYLNNIRDSLAKVWIQSCTPLHSLYLH